MKRWIVLLVVGLAGCVGLPKVVDGPADGAVHQVHATWDNRVHFTEDPLRNGQQQPGLAGRLYFFGPEIGHPLRGTGEVTVDLYDATHKEKKMLERWTFDNDNLQRLLKKDTIGWGYTVFLPWGTYKPEVKRVQIQVRFAPEKGSPLFAPVSSVALN